MKKFEVTFNLGFVSYEVEAESEDEAISKTDEIRYGDGYVSPNSELSEVKEIEPETKQTKIE